MGSLIVRLRENGGCLGSVTVSMVAFLLVFAIYVRGDVIGHVVSWEIEWMLKTSAKIIDQIHPRAFDSTITRVSSINHSRFRKLSGPFLIFCCTVVYTVGLNSNRGFN